MVKATVTNHATNDLEAIGWLEGLSTEEAQIRRSRFGDNVLPERRKDSIAKIFFRQFLSPFVFILLSAALVSFLLGYAINGFFILLVLLINAVIGGIQEVSAQNAASALKQMVPAFVSAKRDGAFARIPANQLVPGDVVALASGDKVAADLQLVHAKGLLINESMLTGESQASVKSPVSPTTERKTMAEVPEAARACAGTLVTHGRGLGLVIATGADSQIGQLAQNVTEPEDQKPPLQQRMERLTLHISLGISLLILLLIVAALWRGETLEHVFFMSVALAVSAIPEGLPAAITIALSIGMRRLANVNVIVRKLMAVESLGSCTYIASDKTGTLTMNELTVRQIVLADGRLVSVSGEGLDIHGDLRLSDQPIHLAEQTSLRQLIIGCVLANEATALHDSASGNWDFSGDGVDIALMVLAIKAGLHPLNLRQRYHELDRIPYESENALCASLTESPQRQSITVKGSVEKILPLCSLQSTADIHTAVQGLAADGYRVIALAQADTSTKQLDISTLPANMTFLGLVAMLDPVRPDAIEAIRRCQQSSIQVAMVTGDHPITALAIARTLGIAGPEVRALTGDELERAKQEGPESLSSVVRAHKVFARISPIQKLDIVRNVIRDGEFVAVTGDGVNDAPALHHAHVGIAMGARGTDVARESADLILTDDRFASIVDGIQQGRVVYNNIRKVVFLLISTGVAEITVFIASVLAGLPLPLFPLQLLWLNLVTNGIQDVALAFEPAEGHELDCKPREPNEPIFNRIMLERILITAGSMGLIAFAVFYSLIESGLDEFSARNLTLLLMVLFENIHVLDARSERQSVFRMRLFSNPFLLIGMMTAQIVHIAALYTPGLSSILQVQPVTLSQWTQLLCIALTLLVISELHKLWHHYRGQS